MRTTTKKQIFHRKCCEIFIKSETNEMFNVKEIMDHSNRENKLLSQNQINEQNN